MSRPCAYLRVLGETSIERELGVGTGARDELQPPADSDKFCHIEVGNGHTAYCGKVLGGPGTCQMYNGEAICPSCGLPTCPSCAVMSNLNERLVGDEEGTT